MTAVEFQRPERPDQAAVTPRFDAVGRITAVGPNVADFVVGQRVAALLIVGGYATHVVAQAAWIVAAPEQLPAETHRGSHSQLHDRLSNAHTQRPTGAGDSIVVHGAAGGVGTALLDLGRSLGLRSFGSASRGKHAVVTRFDATAIDYKTEDFVEVARAAGGVQAVFDHIGGAHLLRSLRAIRLSGAVVSYGAHSVFRNGRIDIVGGAKALLRASALTRCAC